MAEIKVNADEAARTVKTAIEMAIPGSRMFVTPEHCRKVIEVLYSSGYRIVYDRESAGVPPSVH